MVLLIAALLLLLVWMLWPRRPRVPGESPAPFPPGPGTAAQVHVRVRGPEAPPAGAPSSSTEVMPDQLTEDDLIAFGLALESIDDVARDRDVDDR